MKKSISIIILILVGFQLNAQLLVTNINDSGPGSLRDAILSASNGQTIHFSPTLISGSSDTIVLNSQIAFSKNLNIVGLYNSQDTLYISGNGSNRIFSISNTSKVKLDSVVVINGYSGTDGGAISFVNSDSLLISNSKFNNNNCGDNGGAIYMFSLDSIGLVLENTVIANNTSVSNGGGIYIQNTNYGSEAFTAVKVNNCLFHLNFTGSEGGGLYAGTFSSAFDFSRVTIDVENSTFTSNSANTGGGVCTNADSDFNSFATCSGYSEINLTNCIIKENSANGGGGVRSHAQTTNHEIDTAILNINNCLVNNNVAYEGAGVLCYGFVSILNFLDSKAIGNVAYESGGALYCRPYPFTYGTPESFSIVTITNSTIKDNSAVTSGGALYSAPNSPSYDNKTNSNIYVNQSTLNNNSSTIGGAIFSESHANTVELNESTLTGNYSENGSAVYAISHSNYTSSGADIFSNNSTIYKNSAQFKGGAFYAVATIYGESHIYPKSSIIALNGSIPIFNTNTDTVESIGYNIFSEALVSGSVGTDQLNVDSTGLNLLLLDNYGGDTETLMPSSPSAAINMGDPGDFTDAQNVPVMGVRDVGAAEVCQATYGVDLISACDSIVWIDGNTYFAPNSSAVDTIVNVAGCDSIVSLNLIKLNNAGIDTQYVCDSLVWIDGLTYYSDNDSVQFNIIGGNYFGCDSLVTLNLSVFDSQNPFDVITACDSLVWIDGNTYYSDNNVSTVNLSGCIVTLDLTIVNSNAGVDVITACDSLNWIDGNTYYSDNNTATHTLLGSNVNGCDSTVILDLTIQNSTSGTDIIMACDSLNWIDGNTYYTSNNSVTYNLVGGSVNGCDSIVSLDLIVSNSVSSNDSISVCAPYIWIDGNSYTSDNDSASFTYVGGSVSGCDSIVYLKLNILNDSIIDLQTACDSLVWIDGLTYYTDNNTATQVYTNQFGCDSLLVLDLTLNYSTMTTDSITNCGPFTWIDGNTYTVDNNSASYLMTTSNGCDSLVYLNLTVDSVDDNVLQNGTTLSALDSNATYQWLDCNNSYTHIAGAVNQSFNAVVNGSYAVQVTENSCIDTSNCFLIDFIGINEEFIINNVTISPNPTNGRIKINFGKIDNAIIYIYNPLGELVDILYQAEIETSEFIELDGASGIYVLKIDIDQHSKFYRILKE